jgi:NhaP-type Na+/H+ or K+/H+ antiporter
MVAVVVLTIGALYVLFDVIGDQIPWIQHHGWLILIALSSTSYVRWAWLVWKKRQHAG